MATITWTSDLSIGIIEIDNQHKQLLTIINQLHDAMMQNKSKEKMDLILIELKDYTVKHFTFEENLFKKSQYPDVEEHQKIHKEFITKLAEFERNKDKFSNTIGLSTFLMDWLLNHIKKTDKKYAPFIK